MNQEQPKGPRKLQMLPEVLPAPTPTRGGSDVRGRTMAHMRKMLAATAAVAAAGCTREASPSTTVTIPTSSNASTGATSTVPPLHTAPVASATPTATTPPPDIGYAVVDPMPAPARCMGLASASKATATLKRDASGIVLEVSLTLATTGSWQGTAFDTSNPPSPWGGQLVSKSFKGTSVVVAIRPTVPAGSQQTSTSVGVSFPISCAAGPGSVSVTADVPLPLRDGAKATLNLHDF